jgi:hypothetical protein
MAAANTQPVAITGEETTAAADQQPVKSTKAGKPKKESSPAAAAESGPGLSEAVPGNLFDHTGRLRDEGAIEAILEGCTAFSKDTCATPRGRCRSPAPGPANRTRSASCSGKKGKGQGTGIKYKGKDKIHIAKGLTLYLCDGSCEEMLDCPRMHKMITLEKTLRSDCLLQLSHYQQQGVKYAAIANQAFEQLKEEKLAHKETVEAHEKTVATMQEKINALENTVWQQNLWIQSMQTPGPSAGASYRTTSAARGRESSAARGREASVARRTIHGGGH